MRARVAHFVDNVGRGGLARTAIVGLAMVVIAVARFIDGGHWPPLAALVAGGGLPIVSNRLLITHLETTLQVLRVTSYGIVGCVLVFGVLRDRVAVDERILLIGLVGTVTLYLSVFTVVFSDPEVVRQDS